MSVCENVMICSFCLHRFGKPRSKFKKFFILNIKFKNKRIWFFLEQPSKQKKTLKMKKCAIVINCNTICTNRAILHTIKSERTSSIRWFWLYSNGATLPCSTCVSPKFSIIYARTHTHLKIKCQTAPQVTWARGRERRVVKFLSLQ